MKKEEVKKNFMKATTMTWVLIGFVFVFVAGIGFGNWKLQGKLGEETLATSKLKESAEQSNENLAKAELLKLYIEKNETEISRAEAVVAESKTYQYQNQIIEDITSYANTVGITILEFDFPTSIAPPTTTGSLRSIRVNLSLQSPMPYEKFLRFLKLIEQNLTKMQVTDIGISPDKKVTGMIESQFVGLEVYVK